VRNGEWGREVEPLIYADWALICDWTTKARKTPKIRAEITAGAVGGGEDEQVSA